jgi:hypothetical protein
MAHFMGVGGAAKLISNAEDNPQASGARLFPNAAAANRSIFYERGTGRARSVSEVYSVLTQRYASAAASPATRHAMASVGDIPPSVALASAAPAAPAIDNAAYLSTFPDVRTTAPVTIASASTTTNAPPTDPIFRSLFQVGERTQPVSPAVRELWGNSSSLTSVAPAVSVASAAPVASGASVPLLPARTPNVGARQSLDLFSDRSGTFSG